MKWKTIIFTFCLLQPWTHDPSESTERNLRSIQDFYIYRSSHRRCSVEKDVLRNFAKFTRKRLCQSLFFDKVAGLRPSTLLKKRLWHRCFPVNVEKFLKTPFLQNTSGRLLLYLYGDLQTILRFHKNKYTVSSQLQYPRWRTFWCENVEGIRIV